MSEPPITCEQCRIGISSRLDDEDPGCPSVALHAHLAGCADCRAFESEATRLHRVSRVTAAPTVPDLTPRVLAAIGETAIGEIAIGETGSRAAPVTTDHLDAWRLGLAVVALVQIALAIPALLFGTDAGLPVHTARHLGSFDAALGVGFLVIAWKPSRVPGLIPMTVALVAFLCLSSVVDVASGRTAALGELTHTTELLGLALCLLIGRATALPRRGGIPLVGRPA
jgi:predicted anti-sigma-YlaC factor YlaD